MRPRVVIGAGVILGAFVVIAVLAFFANQELYLTVDELVSDPALYAATTTRAAGAVVEAEVGAQVEAPGDKQGETQVEARGEPVAGTRAPGRRARVPRRLQVRGVVDDTSVERSADGLTLRFTLGGRTGRLPVVYRGLVPDTFDQAETVTVAGLVGADGVFEADELLVQCPSKYEAVPPGASVGTR
jgi:cytochrome c-type biogenesis protein CcmE